MGEVVDKWMMDGRRTDLSKRELDVLTFLKVGLPDNVPQELVHGINGKAIAQININGRSYIDILQPFLDDAASSWGYANEKGYIYECADTLYHHFSRLLNHEAKDDEDIVELIYLWSVYDATSPTYVRIKCVEDCVIWACSCYGEERLELPNFQFDREQYRCALEQLRKIAEQKNLFQQFAYPLPRIDNRLHPNKNCMGITSGVLFNTVPFVAEQWQDESDVVVTILLPYIKEFFSEMDDHPLTAKTSNVVGFKMDVECQYYGNIDVGMIVLDEDLPHSTVVKHVDYLIRTGLIRFLGKQENGSAQLLSDYADNSVISLRICLTIDGKPQATTSLQFKPMESTQPVLRLLNPTNKTMKKTSKPKIEKINHLNYPDDEGRIYCRMKNDIQVFEPMDCRDCPLCYGSIQGMGVECFYPDLISENNTALALTVPDPDAQMKWIAALVDKNMMPVKPLDEADAVD